MSAESPKRNNTSLSGSSSRCVPTVIPPQAISDKSIIESVAGFINEVALTNSPQFDAKEQIIWARFETDADISDLSFGEDWDLEDACAPPLILTLGYGTGIQMWAIPANGEAIEILSWRQGGPVKCLKVLPTPLLDCNEQPNPITDLYSHKRPLMAICDSNATINFISLKDGETVKSIKFKHPVVEVLANRTTVVVTFQERIAVFDARTFEDRCTVTKCFPSPGLNPNPVALSTRWMAYAELKVMPSKRSNGGYDGFGGVSAMASVINAAKTLGKGLKGIGETIGLTGQVGHTNAQLAYNQNAPGGGQSNSGGLSPSSSSSNIYADGRQAGIVTIMDIKYPIKEISPTSGTPITVKGNDPVVVHFVAHTDPIVNLAFDPSGMLLLTTDKRGHDFHLFRIYPHASGPSLAAVHHLYTLHRGDTTAKVQDIAFSMDSRWVAVSSLRGTTHVFPITPYGGAVGVRTHGSPHVVNQLSRFHRSAGLSIDGKRSSSPIAYSETQSNSTNSNHHNTSVSNHGGIVLGQSNAYTNPRNPPFPHPTTILPLTQLRQPYTLTTSPSASAQTPHVKEYLFNVTLGRQRHSSLSDDSMMGSGATTALTNPLRVCATFARPRAWLLDGTTRETPSVRLNRTVMDSLFIMASHGSLIQYDLEPKHLSNIAREKVCDDTPIELYVEPKAQWNLLRGEMKFNEIQPPLPVDNWLLKDRLLNARDEKMDLMSEYNDKDDRWLSQVEIITHAGPHRRLWMGPQFIFKTYNTPSGVCLHHIDMDSVEVGMGSNGSNAGLNGGRVARSNPVNMPDQPIVPVLIESGSYSSYEQSPRLSDQFQLFEENDDLEPRESQLREDLADAMREYPSTGPGGLTIHINNAGNPSLSTSTASNTKQHPNQENKVTDGCEDDLHLTLESPLHKGKVTSVENIVNPLGTVTTIIKHNNSMTDSLNSETGGFKKFSNNEQYILENCDESLFRPVVTVAIEKSDLQVSAPAKPTAVSRNLIVPVEIESVESGKPKEPRKIELAPVEMKVDEVEVVQVAEEVKPIKVKQNKNKRNKNDDKEKLAEKLPQIRGDVTMEQKTDTISNAKKTATKKLKKNAENCESEFVIVIESEKATVDRVESPDRKLSTPPEIQTEVETSFTVQLRQDSPKEYMKQSSYKPDFVTIQDSLMKDSFVPTATFKNKNKAQPKPIEQDAKVEEDHHLFDISDTKLDLEYDDNIYGQEEDMYTDPLVPLEPFDSSVFENLEFAKSDDQCLMTFESPLIDNDLEDEAMAIPEVRKGEHQLRQLINDKNLIFAMCTSLQEGDDEERGEEDNVVQEEHYPIDEGLELKIEENYMDLDKCVRMERQKASLRPSPVLTASTGSSEEEPSTRSSDSATTNSGGKQTNTTGDEEAEDGEPENARDFNVGPKKPSPQEEEEDEELRPLLKNMTSSKNVEEAETTVESCLLESKKDADKQSEPKVAKTVETVQLKNQQQQQQQSKKKSRKKKR